jgi:phage-related protein
VNDFTHILDGVEDRVEGADLELIDDTTEALPDVLGITEALNTVRNLSLNGTGKETLEDLAHSEEGEVDIRALHGLEVVHLLVLLVIDLVKKLLPVVAEVIEKFIMVNHLGLSVKEHGGGLAEVLASVEPLAHAVVVETLTGILEDVNSVNDEGLSGLEENLLGVKEGLSHSLDLLIVVMIDLSAVIKHVTNV